jgi:hypothetical protein
MMMGNSSIWNGEGVQVFGKNPNESKFYSGRTEVRDCLLSCGAEYFVFQFAIRKFKV